MHNITPGPTYLITTVIHLHILTIHIDVLVSIIEHCSWPGIPGIARHVVSHHQDYLTEKYSFVKKYNVLIQIKESGIKWMVYNTDKPSFKVTATVAIW